MKTLKIILLIVIFLLLVLIPHIGTGVKDTEVIIIPVQAQVITPEEMSVEEMISSIAPRWNQDPKLISKISWCESHHEVKVHDGGYGLGVTGIHKRLSKDGLQNMKQKMGKRLTMDRRMIS